MGVTSQIFKIGLKDRFGRFRNAKIEKIKRLETRRMTDYYISQDHRSFGKKKKMVSGPGFVSLS